MQRRKCSIKGSRPAAILLAWDVPDFANNTTSRWCSIIILNIHAPTDNKTDDTKDSFYGELERVLNEFSKYLTKNF
jgi:hypothetical protein